MDFFQTAGGNLTGAEVGTAPCSSMSRFRSSAPITCGTAAIGRC